MAMILARKNFGMYKRNMEYYLAIFWLMCVNAILTFKTPSDIILEPVHLDVLDTNSGVHGWNLGAKWCLTEAKFLHSILQRGRIRFDTALAYPEKGAVHGRVRLEFVGVVGLQILGQRPIAEQHIPHGSLEEVKPIAR